MGKLRVFSFICMYRTRFRSFRRRHHVCSEETSSKSTSKSLFLLQCTCNPPPPFPRPIYVTRVDSQVLSATSNALGTYLSYRAGENTAPLSLRKQGRCRPYCSCCLDSALGQEGGGGGEGEEGEGERGGREGRREWLGGGRGRGWRKEGGKSREGGERKKGKKVVRKREEE